MGVPSGIRDSSAWSAQEQLAWKADDETALRLSVSSRARLPTIFERFSQRFGTSIPRRDAPLVASGGAYWALRFVTRNRPFRFCSDVSIGLKPLSPHIAGDL